MVPNHILQFCLVRQSLNVNRCAVLEQRAGWARLWPVVPEGSCRVTTAPAAQEAGAVCCPVSALPQHPDAICCSPSVSLRPFQASSNLKLRKQIFERTRTRATQVHEGPAEIWLLRGSRGWAPCPCWPQDHSCMCPGLTTSPTQTPAWALLGPAREGLCGTPSWRGGTEAPKPGGATAPLFYQVRETMPRPLRHSRRKLIQKRNTHLPRDKPSS